MEQVAFDCSVLEFVEKVSGKSIMLKYNEYVSLRKYFFDCYTIYASHCPMTISNGLRRRKFDEILCLGEGKISVFGSSIIKGKHLEYYLHSCDKLQQDKIIQNISNSNIVKKMLPIKGGFHLLLRESLVVLHVDPLNSRENILYNMKCSEMKHCWNPINGYCCTVVAGLTSILDTDETIDVYNSSKVDIYEFLLTKYTYLSIYSKQYGMCKDLFVEIFGKIIYLLTSSAKEMLINTII